MTAHEHRPSEAARSGDERLGIVECDRFCTHCGYNLAGQTIVREPHYRMLVIRCAECGTIASVQEYPTLGRWSRAWSLILAALWALFVLSLLASGAAALAGMSYAVGEVSAEKLRDALYEEYRAWNEAQTVTTPQSGIITLPNGMTIPVRPGMTVRINQQQQTSFIDTVDLDEVFASIGGWSGGVQWLALLLLIPQALIGAVLGLFWSVIFFGARWKRLMLVGLINTALAALFLAPQYWHVLVGEPYGYWNAGLWVVGPAVMPIALAVGLLGLWIGALIGRPCTRGLLRFALPPRLLSSLVVLWQTDGRPLPGLRVAAMKNARAHREDERGRDQSEGA